MSTKDGGPAFPYSALTPTGPQIYGDCMGMTLRDYFAAKALVGLLAHTCDADKRQWSGIEGATKRAYEYADAMLAERAK